MPSLYDSNATDSLDRSEVTDYYNQNLLSGSISVGTTGVEAKVGANPLANRKCLMITNLGQNTVYFGAQGVSVATGTPIEKNQVLTISVGPNVRPYLVAGNGANDVRILEIA